MENKYDMASDYVQKYGPGGETKEMSSIIKALQSAPILYSHSLIQECEKTTQGAYARWKRYRRKYRKGKRYGGSALTGQPEYTTNYVFNVVETLKSNLTRYLPAINVRPQEAGDAKASEIMTKVLQKGLDNAKFKAKLRDCVHHSALTGYGYLKVSYDQDACKGEGEVSLDVVAPEDLLRLPYELDFYNCSFLAHRVRDVQIDEIKATYGVKEVKGDFNSSLGEGNKLNRNPSEHFSAGMTVDMYEIWVKNYFENKWYYMTIAGETVLKELTPNPFDHGKLPFVLWVDNYDAGAEECMDSGAGEIEEIEALQDYADALDGRIYKNIKSIVARQKVLNPASGIDASDIDDTPSKVYLCTGKPQDAMYWDTPPNLASDVYMTREKIEDRIQIVTGIFEVAQGQKPSGIRAAKAITALQQAGQARFEYKTESLLEAIKDACELILETQLQYYSDTRIIRLEGGESVVIMDSYPDSITVSGVDPITGEPTGIKDDPVAKAQWRQENNVDLVLEDIDFNYDLVVSTHSNLPADRGARSQLHFDLFRVGAIDRRALLDGLDYPEKMDILERLAAKTTGKTPPEADPNTRGALQENELMKSMLSNSGGDMGEQV